MKRRSFLKGLCAAAALAISGLLPELAPRREPDALPDGWHYVRIRYMSTDGGTSWLSGPMPHYSGCDPVVIDIPVEARISVS